MDVYEIIEKNTEVAVENSKKLEKVHIENGEDICNVNCNPYTSVYKPVEYIIKRDCK